MGTATPPTIRVLVADDHSLVRDALGSVIALEPGLELVAGARDADEAIFLARRLRPDVALIDVRMPGSGRRAVQEIRTASPSTRIVALSAEPSGISRHEMHAAGACAYLVKGGTNDDILSVIRRAAPGSSLARVGID